MYTRNGSARYVPKLSRAEENMHRRICTYLRQEFPGVMFRTDGGGLALSPSQATIYKSMQHSAGWPDLFIPAAKHGYNGLFLELKIPGTKIYITQKSRAGQLVADPHIRQQASVLNYLNNNGYLARFAIGEEKAKAIINWYLDKPENVELF